MTRYAAPSIWPVRLRIPRHPFAAHYCAPKGIASNGRSWVQDWCLRRHVEIGHGADADFCEFATVHARMKERVAAREAL